MNLRRCFILLLATAGWLAGQPLLAGGATASDNPYASIVTRNVFDLVPIPVHNPADDVPVVPPPKITPNGIMTLFGKLQVLFKVANNRPGQPPKDDSYVMCEGDRQDDIAVQKIDEKSATITFNNHGVVQELPLVAATAAGSGPVSGPAGSGRPGMPMPGVAPSAAGHPPIGFGGRFGRNSAVTPPASPTSASFTPTPAPITQAQPVMPVEQQVIIIEAQRMKYQQEGDPTAQILPPTELTSQATGQDGDGGDAAPAPAPGD